MTDIKLPECSMIKIFKTDQEVNEYLKPYSSYYWDMSHRIKDLKKHYEEDIVNKSKDKQEVFDKIMEQLDEAGEGYYEKLND